MRIKQRRKATKTSKKNTFGHFEYCKSHHKQIDYFFIIRFLFKRDSVALIISIAKKKCQHFPPLLCVRPSHSFARLQSCWRCCVQSFVFFIAIVVVIICFSCLTMKEWWFSKKKSEWKVKFFVNSLGLSYQILSSIGWLRMVINWKEWSWLMSVEDEAMRWVGQRRKKNTVKFIDDQFNDGILRFNLKFKRASCLKRFFTLRFLSTLVWLKHNITKPYAEPWIHAVEFSQSLFYLHHYEAIDVHRKIIYYFNSLSSTLSLSLTHSVALLHSLLMVMVGTEWEMK